MDTKEFPVPGAAPRPSATDDAGPLSAHGEERCRWRSMVENAPDIITRFDLELRHRYVSPAIEREVGLKAEAFLGRTHEELAREHDLPDAFWQQWRGALTRVRETGREEVVQYDFPTPEGVSWYECRIVPERDPGGAVESLLSIGRNVTALRRLEHALWESRERTRRILEGSHEAFVAMDQTGRIVDWNAQAERTFGWRREEAVGRSLVEVLVPEPERDKYVRALGHFLRTGEGAVFDQRVEVSAVHRDGRIFPVELTATPIRVGEQCLFTAFLHDITDRKSAAAALESREALFRALTDNAQDLTTIVDAEGTIRFSSPSVQKLLGYTPEEAVGQKILEMVHRDDRAALATLFETILSTPHEPITSEYRYRHRNGRWVVLEAIARNLLDDPAVGGVVVNSRDVTDRRHAEDRLREAALTDPLTGLPNRLLFMERLRHAIQRARRHGRFAVLFLDLDRFKVVNDSLGHHVGDELLVTVAERLRTALRPEDTVARMGGDEFAILLEDLNEPADAAQVAQRVIDALSVKVHLSGYDVFTSTSIGIVYGTPDDSAAEYLLRSADMAMYRAKAGGAGRYEVFDRAMHAEALSRLQLETDLRHAVEREEFRVYYQPVIDLVTGQVTGLEALVRWQHPGQGLVQPAGFIAAAEETGLIVPIGEWVLREVCTRLPAWKERFRRPLTVAVNLSVKQFAQADLVERVERILQDTGADPGSLKLEITESVVMESHEGATRTIERLKALGIQVHMDDFGTGYSSLSYLHALPLDALKIDRSFIMQMVAGDRNSQLVRTMLTLASSVGMQVVAEGVNTLDQLSELRSLGCEYGQGFLFSAPISPEDVDMLLEADPRW